MIGAPLAAADEAPPAAPSAEARLCALVPNPLLTAGFGALADCTASAQCAPFTAVSCNASGGNSTCTAVDRNCFAGERGYVTCNWSTIYCAGVCCGEDGVCEYDYGCGCSDPDCCALSACQTAPECTSGDCSQCHSITNCLSDRECSLDCPGSICTSGGICLCPG